MKTRSTPLPEPELPEHQLIRSSAPLPVLSNSLRERVLADCSARIRAARLKHRIQCFTAALAVCCIVCLLVWHRGYLTERPSTAVEQAVQHNGEQSEENEPAPEPFRSLGDAAGSDRAPLNKISSSPDDREKGSPIAADPPKAGEPATPGAARELRSIPRDLDQLQYLIEELQQRDRKLCGVLLWR